VTTNLSIGVQNFSHAVTSAEIQAAIGVFEDQVNIDFGYYWNLKPQVTLTPTKPSPNVQRWNAYIFDDVAQAIRTNSNWFSPIVTGAVGWHTIQAALPYMVVLAGTSNSSFRAFNSWTWTFSHELMEMIANPQLQYVGPYYPATGGAQSAVKVGAEVCDPVEGTGYLTPQGPILSNFVTPSWFNPQGQPDWDFLETLPGPLTTGPGGTTDVELMS
jgi:hypothetical protein